VRHYRAGTAIARDHARDVPEPGEGPAQMIGLRGMLGRTQPDDAGRAGPIAESPSPHASPATTRDARLATLVARDVLKRRAMVSARVVADPVRCMECGICSYNCPLGIDVRLHVRRGLPVSDSRCLTCGECVARCPRGTLRFEESTVFAARFAAEGK
jgi:ferredoxin